MQCLFQKDRNVVDEKVYTCLSGSTNGRAETPVSFCACACACATRIRDLQFGLHIVIEPNTKHNIQLNMSITELEQRCHALRNDLKAWEKQFAAQHNGKKAGREDIKADAVICMHAT